KAAINRHRTYFHSYNETRHFSLRQWDCYRRLYFHLNVLSQRILPMQSYMLFHSSPCNQIKTTSVNWWFALRLKAYVTGHGLTGPPDGFPFAPHSLTDSKRIYYFFLFFLAVNGSNSSINVNRSLM